jgi:hypothetical protein
MKRIIFFAVGLYGNETPSCYLHETVIKEARNEIVLNVPISLCSPSWYSERAQFPNQPESSFHFPQSLLEILGIILIQVTTTSFLVDPNH